MTSTIFSKLKGEKKQQAGVLLVPAGVMLAVLSTTRSILNRALEKLLHSKNSRVVLTNVELQQCKWVCFGPVVDIHYYVFLIKECRCYLIVFLYSSYSLSFEIWEVDLIVQIHLLLELYAQFSSLGQAGGIA